MRGNELQEGKGMTDRENVQTVVYITVWRKEKRRVKVTTGRGGPRGSGYVKTPDFLDVRHYEGGRSSAVRTGRLYPRRNPWYSFSEAESTSGDMVPSVSTGKITIEEKKGMKNKWREERKKERKRTGIFFVILLCSVRPKACHSTQWMWGWMGLRELVWGLWVRETLLGPAENRTPIPRSSRSYSTLNTTRAIDTKQTLN